MFPVIHKFDFFGALKEPWSLHTYGLLIATGFLFAMMLGKRQAAREGEDPERIVDLSFYVLLAGLVGSRLVFIFTKLDDYLENPFEIVMFWRGGLVWYGGAIGGLLTVTWWIRRKGLPFLIAADLLGPLLLLGQGMGRIGGRVTRNRRAGETACPAPRAGT